MIAIQFDLAEGLAEVCRRKLLMELSHRSRLGYSYLWRLAKGRQKFERMQPRTRGDLERGIREVLQLQEPPQEGRSQVGGD